VCGRPSPEWCLAIAVAKIAIMALKDVWQPEANATIEVNEENGKLKRGFGNVTANVDIVSWGPSPLRYNNALRQLDIVI
jgi:hypothetical protein